MNCRLLIVGYEEDISFVLKDLASEIDYVELQPFAIERLCDDNIHSIVEKLISTCDKVSGVIYLRKELFLALSPQATLPVPSRYSEYTSSHLLQNFLRIRVQTKDKISGVSIDSVSIHELQPLLKDPDIFSQNVRIWETSPNEGSYQSDAAMIISHKKNIKEGAHLVFTNRPSVYEAVKAIHENTFLLRPDSEAIKHEIQILRLSINLRNQQNNLAVIYLVPRYKISTIDLFQSQLREAEELSKITKAVSIFAHSIDGSAIPLSRYEYLVLCNEYSLDLKTSHYSDISLLSKTGLHSIFDITIAIGTGSSAKAAYESAMMSYAVSLRIPQSNAVITFDKKQTLDPILIDKSSVNDTISDNERLIDMAKDSHISYETLHMLFLASHARQSNLFSSSDIAEALGVSVRTANRLIQRLLDSHHAEIISSLSLNRTGRPNRVIKINFDIVNHKQNQF